MVDQVFRFFLGLADSQRSALLEHSTQPVETVTIMQSVLVDFEDEALVKLGGSDEFVCHVVLLSMGVAGVKSK